MTHAGTVVCWGELLWDVFAEGRHPGGSALNVAVHLHNLGFDAVLASAVGDDEAGSQLVDAVAGFGLNTDFICVAKGLPTGTAGITTGDDGLPRFSIKTDTAWDSIPVSKKLKAVAARSCALVYGSLAQRSAANRTGLNELIQATPGLKVMDVNLRPPHDDVLEVMSITTGADIIKVNEDELRRLTRGRDSDLESQARLLSRATGASTVCATAGAAGAGLLYNGSWYWEDSRPVEVVDTVGAGDAFLARLLSGIINHESPHSALSESCRAAEAVVCHCGAIITKKRFDS